MLKGSSGGRGGGHGNGTGPGTPQPGPHAVRRVIVLTRAQ